MANQNANGRVAAVPAHLAEHEDDAYAAQAGYVRGTDFSLPYSSPWSRMHQREVDAGVLRHVCCGFLSTPGTPPTLLALKLHAQSLCVLIRALDPTLRSAEILTGPISALDGDASRQQQQQQQKDAGDNAMIMRSGRGGDAHQVRARINDAFDWLADLSTPYANDDPNHHKPLTALLNEVLSRQDLHGTTYHCPFETAPPARHRGAPAKPYATHHNLLMHANACLERLDHEFSASGGLLGVLPTGEAHDTQQLAAARNSLLGQWLLHTQRLVARVHELERAYANAVDALAGEAALAHQHLSALGPDARATGRTVAFPQDRWVLVNAGEDVFSHLHRELDKREATMQAREQAWRECGVAGERLRVARPKDEDAQEQDELARGIVAVDVVTRYYRLAGRQGHGTLFVVPAYAQHPGVAYTRDVVEKQPTVVACVQPKFPVRASELEKRYDARIARAADAELKNLKLSARQRTLDAEVDSLRSALHHANVTQDGLVQAVGRPERELAVELERSRRDAADLRAQAEKHKAQSAKQARHIKQLEEKNRKEHGTVTRLLQLLKRAGIDPQSENTDMNMDE